MCGIFGAYAMHGVLPEPDAINCMAGVISHRGPDDRGVHRSDRAIIGNNRLSIIDLSGGHQPFVSDDGQIAVVQNGEIFNYVELSKELRRTGHGLRTHSDTEVLLRLYERDGIEFVRHLNGMFAIAIYDGRNKTLHLVRDRLGVKPLFIWNDENRLLFASEIKALLAAGVERQPNFEALHHFLSFNYVPPPWTMFRGIRHLLPGHRLSISPNGMHQHRWWEPNRISQRSGVSEQSAISDFNEILDDAVGLRLRADVPYGAFLSGGVDSSSVVGLMAGHQDDPVNTFAIGFDEPRFDESAWAQMASKRFNTSHVNRTVKSNMIDLWPMATWHCDQPHGDVSFMPTYRVSELAAKDVKVVLTGDGGDELFAGYDKYKNFFSGASATNGDSSAFRTNYISSISLLSESAKRSIYSSKLSREVGHLDSRLVANAVLDEVADWDHLNQALYLDTLLLLPGNNLVKPDRMGMAVSLEARTPFLDYRMVEFALGLPSNLKLRDGVTKYIFKKAVTPLIGEELAYRKKQMFTVPVGEWFRSGLSGFLRDVLLDQRTQERDLFCKVGMERMISQHLNGSHNHTRELRAFVALEIWFRIFIDGPLPESPPSLKSIGINFDLNEGT